MTMIEFGLYQLYDFLCYGINKTKTFVLRNRRQYTLDDKIRIGKADRQ